jgi:hypothetical protein
VMHRVKAKTDADKKEFIPGQKRSASDDKMSKPQQRRRSSQQGKLPVPLSPTAISPRAPTLPLLAAQESPTNAFTPGVHTSQSFTPQSGSTSSPGGSELIYPFSLTQQGIYTPFGNSPPLFPVAGQQQPVQNEMMDVTRDDDSGQFWQSLFGPPGSSLQPPLYTQGFAAPFQGQSPGRATGEFRDPNDVGIDITEGGEVNLDDAGLVDWGDFIAQCSQVWVTE